MNEREEIHRKKCSARKSPAHAIRPRSARVRRARSALVAGEARTNGRRIRDENTILRAATVGAGAPASLARMEPNEIAAIPDPSTRHTFAARVRISSNCIERTAAFKYTLSPI
ncbi:MAG: hypothetical protein MZU95_00580 [Desulfomicrobium escambiense]|nr:hypothetical protein [Desulfomicrobium escambiense]